MTPPERATRERLGTESHSHAARCQRHALLVPNSFAVFEEEIRRWMAGCVTSRTRDARGLPAHRETDLVGNNPSLQEVWAEISEHRNLAVEIRVRYTWVNDRVEGLVFSTDRLPHPNPPGRRVPPTPDPPREYPGGSAIPSLIPRTQAPGIEPLEIIGLGTHFVGFLAELTAIIAQGIVVGVLEGLGAILGIIATAISLPAAWMAQDSHAFFSGRCHGLWEAYCDMAQAYGSTRLDSQPLTQWPPIPHPSPHTQARFGRVPESQRLELDRQFIAGLRQGCQEAYQSILDLERSPRPYAWNHQGRRTTIQITGRLFLRILYRWMGRNVDRAIKEEILRHLRQQGRAHLLE